MIRSCFFFLLIFSSVSSFADVRLPSVIGDHMVLQQNTTVKIWGWSDVNEKIRLKTGWDTSTYTATASPNAKWSIELKTPVAGGPYKITINGRNTIIIDDVLIGEVWLCSGQSNMEMSASWGLKQFEPDVAAATNKTSGSFIFQELPRHFRRKI
jgi:sialate O-acetylesterase